MKKAHIGVLTSLLFVATPLAQQAVTASIQGRVLRSGGNQPIAGVRVTAQHVRNNTMVLAATNASGSFSVVGLLPGTYRLTFEARGFMPHVHGQRVQDGTWTPIDVEAGQTVRDLTVRLTPGGNIEGRIRDAQGLPAVGAPVALLRSGYTQDGKKTLIAINSVETDDRGEYRFFWIPDGRYYLRAGGRVGFSTGFNPQANITSVGNRYLESFSALFYPAALTGDTASPIDIRAGADLQGVDFRLQRQKLLNIRGRVIDSQTGLAPASATIRIRGESWEAGSFGYDKTDGGFEIRGLWPGEYILVANINENQAGVRAPTPVSDAIPIRVVDRDVENLILHILPPVSLSGRVVFEGNDRRPQGLSLRLESIETRLPILLNSNTLIGPITADGSFKIPQIVPGNYSVELSSPEFYVKQARYGGTDAAGESLKLDGNGSTPLEVVLAPNLAQVSVRVTDASLRPAAGAHLVFMADRGRHRVDALKQVMTDARGEYVFQNVWPGNYKLYAWEAPVDWRDPDVLKKFDRNVRVVTVAELSAQTIDATLIPAREP
jgi:hypothetical protein